MSNVIKLFINEDTVQQAINLICGSDVCGNNYLKVVLGLNDDANDQLMHVLEHRKIVDREDFNGNRKVLINRA